MKKLFLLSLSAVVLAACGVENAENEAQETNEDTHSSSVVSEEVSSESIQQETSSSSAETQEIPKHGLNEPVTMILDNPDEHVAEVNVTRVTDNIEAFPDYLKNGDYYDVNKLILIEVEYKNIAYPENISFGLHDFQVFSEDGKQLSDISQQQGGDPVAPGRTGSAQFYIESEEPQDKIELDFLPDGANYPIATYVVDVEH